MRGGKLKDREYSNTPSQRTCLQSQAPSHRPLDMDLSLLGSPHHQPPPRNHCVLNEQASNSTGRTGWTSKQHLRCSYHELLRQGQCSMWATRMHMMISHITSIKLCPRGSYRGFRPRSYQSNQYLYPSRYFWELTRIGRSSPLPRLLIILIVKQSSLTQFPWLAVSNPYAMYSGLYSVAFPTRSMR